MDEDALRWPTMAYDRWTLLGGFRLCGGSLWDLVMDFSTVDAFEMGLETGLTLVLVNLNGTGGAGAGLIQTDLFK